MSKRTFTPRSTVSQTAISGSDQALSAGVDFPDSQWWVWAGNGNVTARVQFPAPITPPQAGADLQLIRLLLRKSADGGNATPCDINLYQNGVLLASLASGVTPSTFTGEVFQVTWDAALLQTAEGSLLEVEVVQTAGGSGNPANRRGVEIGSIEWTYEDGIGARRLVRHRACDGSCCVAAPRFPLGDGVTVAHQGSDCQFHLTSVNGKENHGCQIMENTVLLPNPGTPSALKGESRDALTMFLETCLDWPQNTAITKDLGSCCWVWEDDL